MSTPVFVYQIQQSDLDSSTNGLIFKITFYTQAILGKFIPCLLLVTFSSLLIHSLVVINRKNKRLNKASGFQLRKKTSPEIKSGRCAFLRPITCIGKRQGASKRQGCDENQTQTQATMTTTFTSELVRQELPNQSQRNLLNASGSKLAKSVSLFTQPEAESSRLFTPTMTTTTTSKSVSITRRLSEIKFANKLMSKFDPTQAKTKSTGSLTPIGNNVKPIKRNKTKENLRTTLMLIIVCILFLITEFPQSILILFSIIRGEDFYKNVYMPLGDLLDMLALINNSINFLLYCTMR
jgi:hypothetical protein